MLLRVLKIILLLIIVLVLSRNLLIKSSIENIFKSLKIEGFSLGKVNLSLKDFKLSLDLENINLKNNTIGNLKLVVNSIDYPLFTNSSYIRIKCESIDIQSLKANLTSLKQLFNIDSNKESKKDSRTNFDQKLNLLIKLKGIEHFIPLETLKLNYIIPGDLIPISVKGTISELNVNIALSKVVTTVEPKLLQKIQNSLIKILFNKPSP